MNDKAQKFVEDLETKQLKKGKTAYNKTEKEYKKAENLIVKDAKAFVGEHMNNNKGEDLAKILSPMDRSSLKEYRKELEDLFGKAEELNHKELNKIITKIKRNLRPSYIDGFTNKSDLEMGIANSNADWIASEHLEEVYVDVYEGVAGEFGYSFDLPNKRSIRSVVGDKWLDGVDFSERLWGSNQTKLINNIKDDMMQSILIGEDARKTSRRLRDRMKTSYSNAERIIRTETNRINSQSAVDSYEDGGLERYEISAHIDARTNDICRRQDGRIYDLNEYLIGTTAPPFHPNCRTVIVPIVDEEED